MLKRTGISLALLLVLVMVLALVGCGGSETPKKTTDVSATDVMNAAMAKQAAVTSETTNVTISLDWEGSDNGSGSFTSTGPIDLDPTQKTMHSRSTVGLYGMLTLSLDAYIVDNYTYVQVTLPGNQAAGWAKQPVESAFWESLSFAQYESDLSGFIGTMTKTYLREETYKGETCYVLQLTPNIADLETMLSQPDLDQMITSMSSTVWVSEETSRFMKMQFSSEITIPSEMLVGVDLSSYGLQVAGDLTVKLDLTMEFSNFNQVPSISLSTEAQGATEQPIDTYFLSALAPLMGLA